MHFRTGCEIQYLNVVTSSSINSGDVEGRVGTLLYLDRGAGHAAIVT